MTWRERFLCNWRRAADTRRRGKWYIGGYLACIMCFAAGVIEPRLFVLGFLGMPYFLFGLMYSDHRAPKSRSVWCFLVLFSIIYYGLFTIIALLGGKQNLGLVDILLLSLLVALGSSQLRLLFRVRPLVFGAGSSKPKSDASFRDYNVG